MHIFLIGDLRTVQETVKALSVMAIHQAHKQNNGKAMGEGGAFGLTENSAALRRWMVSGQEVARLITEFEASSETEERMKPGSTKHHEEARTTQLFFAKDVKSLISVIEDMGKPFTEASGDLLILDTQYLAAASVLKTVEEPETLGQEQFETFFEREIKKGVPTGLTHASSLIRHSFCLYNRFLFFSSYPL